MASSHYLKQCWHHQKIPETFLSGQFHMRNLRYQSIKLAWRLLTPNSIQTSQGPMNWQKGPSTEWSTLGTGFLNFVPKSILGNKSTYSWYRHDADRGTSYHRTNDDPTNWRLYTSLGHWLSYIATYIFKMYKYLETCGDTFMRNVILNLIYMYSFCKYSIRVGTLLKYTKKKE